MLCWIERSQTLATGAGDEGEVSGMLAWFLTRARVMSGGATLEVMVEPRRKNEGGLGEGKGVYV